MTKIKLQIKNRWTGAVLFEFEKDGNTIKDTVTEAVKSGADLRCAYLGGADLRCAYLVGADLGGADLRCADLRCANLGDADLRCANLGGADLRCAYLVGADLGGADLGDAYLGDAYLRCAYLGDAKNVPFIPQACPSDGAFIAWKKVEDQTGYYLVKLEIPADARRSSATGTKCRCDKAKVLAVTSLDETETFEEVTNYAYGKETTYTVGAMVYPDSFDDNRWNECSHGIHFFTNKQEAINY